MRIKAEITFEVPMATLARLDDWGMTPWTYIYEKVSSKFSTRLNDDYKVESIKVGNITEKSFTHKS